MFLFASIICSFIALIVCVFLPKRMQYNKLDKIGLVLNIILSVIYVPISLFGVFSVMMADAMHMYSETVKIILSFMIYLGISLPIISIVSIALSVFFRKKGKSVLSFFLQFIPLFVFAIIVIVFQLTSNVTEVNLL